MPAVRISSYCYHKARNLAYVRDCGKVRYLGKFGSPASKEAYARFLIEWNDRQAGLPLPAAKHPDDLTIVELCDQYLTFAQRYYVKDGRPSGEISTVHRSIRQLNECFGHTDAAASVRWRFG